MSGFAEYEDFDALGLAALVRERGVSAHGLLEAAIARVGVLNPKLNVVTITMYDAAQATLDAGLPDGPLAGVAFLLKDLGAAYAFVGKVTGEGFVSRARAAMPKGGTVRVANRVTEVKTPHAYNWGHPAFISTHVCQQLVRTGQDNISRPHLAERWEASDDLKTWTLHRRKISWRNGRPFTAADVLWNLNHILDPETGSSSVGLMKGYMLEEFETGEVDDKGNPKKSHKLWEANAIEKIDDHTVRLNLKVPHVAIPEDLFHYTNSILDPEEGGFLGPARTAPAPSTWST